MRRNLFCFIVLFVCLICLSSCFFKTDDVSNLVVASWNVENLFNGEDDGNEYEEYLSSSGWSNTQYQVRLTKLATVLGYSGISEADVIVLNEVENEKVVEDILSTSAMKKRGFCYYACAGEDGGAIKLAVISSIQISDVKIHSIDGQRPILEVCFVFGNQNVHLLAVHAKSNSGEEALNLEKRSDLGNVLQLVASRIVSSDVRCSVIVAGDFNEEFDDGNVVQNSSDWVCFWDNQQNLSARGSYLYDDEWKKYDNILISSSSSLKLESADVVFSGILQDVEGNPDSWKRYLLSGVSDHLPVWVSLSLI